MRKNKALIEELYCDEIEWEEQDSQQYGAPTPAYCIPPSYAEYFNENMEDCEIIESVELNTSEDVERWVASWFEGESDENA